LRDFLVDLAESEHLKQEAAPLHVFALASLGAFTCDTKVTGIFERDIQDIKYAALCYRALWKFNPAYAQQYVNLILEMKRKDKRFPAELLLKEVNEHHCLGIELQQLPPV
jgi:hypothetical protein